METDRLILRRYGTFDFQDLYEYLSDSEVVKFEPYKPMTCQGNTENKNLIPNGYVGAPASSQYIKTRLKEADRRIAKDISGLV